MGKQGKGRRLTDKERLEIIALTRQNPRIKHVELAAKYSVNESTIRKWRAQANASKIEERYAHGVAASRDGRQRGQAVRNAQFDAELYDWVVDMTKQGVDLAPARVREKARALAAQYDGMDGFKASSGWFYRFCRRYGLPCGPAGRAEAVSNLHDDITIATMMPVDVNARGAAEVALAQHASAVAAAQASLAAAEQAHAALTHVEDDDMGASNSDPAAIAMSLQPPPPAGAAPVMSASPAEEAAVEEGTAVTDTSELEDKAQVPVVEPTVAPPAAASDLLLGLGEMAAVPAPAESSAAELSSSAPATTAVDAVTTSSIAGTTVVPTVSVTAVAAPPQAFSMAQAAATHMVQHFKGVLDPQTRLRLVRHFTHVAGEAEMYLVMDDETRLEYVKEFAATSPLQAAPASAESAS